MFASFILDLYISFAHHVIQTLKLKQTSDFCRKIFAATSNRRVTDPTQVIDKLEFVTADRNFTDLYMLMRRCFRLRLMRWLYGRGHPLSLKGTCVPEDVFESEREDPLVRARLLLKAVTDSDLLPIGEGSSIRVRLDSSHHSSTLILLISSS